MKKSSRTSRKRRRVDPGKAAVERWRAEALAVPGEVLSASVPLPVLLAEAAATARFFRKYWAPSGKRRGLAAAANERLGAGLGRDLLSLRRAVAAAQAAYLLAAGAAPGPSPLARGRLVLREIVLALRWLLDGDEGDDGRELARLRAAHRAPRGAAALAKALTDLAGLAERRRAALDGVGGFDPASIDEARALAAALVRRPATGRALPPAAAEALALRNKLVALLRDRIATVRAAARFVFRAEPAIIREATSAYERERRARARESGDG